MSNFQEEFATVSNEIKEYVAARLQLAKIEASEFLSKMIGGIIFGVVVFTMLLCCLFFLLLALGFYLSEYFHSTYWGFISVGAIYLVLLLFLTILRKPLVVNPIQNRLLKKMFKDDKIDIN